MKFSRGCLTALLGLASATGARAEFLFAPANPSDIGFFTPTLDYQNLTYEYSAWDIFYAPRGAGNYPDKFAPYGGYWNGTGWVPETRTAANNNSNNSGAHVPGGGFTAGPFDNPTNALAFWDTRNATITQTLSNTTFIVGPDISGNIYTFQDKTAFSLKNAPDYGGEGTGMALFQFQTDGSLVDFSSIKLIYYDANHQALGEISALDAEYLREYHSSAGGHWSASAGYSNRVLLQWDTTGLTDAFGNAFSSFEIVWASQSSSMSFQKAGLITASTYQAGMPISATWSGGNGAWSNNSNWALHAPSGLTAPQENGNIKFANTVAAVVSLDGNHAVGEVIFQSPENVTINATGGAFLTANTGVTTQATATGTYVVNAAYHLGALNFFEINAGTVRMGGAISGGYGLVKSGAGTLVLGANNTFTEFLGVQGGAVRIEGTNTYTGSTTIVNGTVIVARDAGATGALGSNILPIALGGDESLYHFSTGIESWEAGLFIDGQHTINRDIALAPGNLGKRLGAFNATAGATFSGTINYTTDTADPDATDTAAGNVKLTAQAATDQLIFSGAMTGGVASRTVTLDGAGTVVYSGTAKTYANATVVAAGRLEIASGTGFQGNGDMTISAGAEIIVHGSLSGSGAMVINGGTVAGTGTINRTMTIDNGDVLAPGTGIGTLQTAAQTWGAGGRFSLELFDADSAAGWDAVNITGSLSLSATSATPFVLQLSTLTTGGASGALQDFNPSTNYSWLFATASSGITGFDSAKFTIDSTGFQNFYDGTFSVSAVGNNLYLNYLAVPEPSAAWLFMGSLLGLTGRRWRRAGGRR